MQILKFWKHQLFFLQMKWFSRVHWMNFWTQSFSLKFAVQDQSPDCYENLSRRTPPPPPPKSRQILTLKFKIIAYRGSKPVDSNLCYIVTVLEYGVWYSVFAHCVHWVIFNKNSSCPKCNESPTAIILDSHHSAVCIDRVVVGTSIYQIPGEREIRNLLSLWSTITGHKNKTNIWRGEYDTPQGKDWKQCGWYAWL